MPAESANVGRHRLVGFGSYQTAWAMLHRYRSVMASAPGERLRGTVEVDETHVGGVDQFGHGGRSHDSRKALVAVAIEQRQPKGLGRCRLEVIPDAGTPTLRAFLARNVEPGSTVLTDGWKPYIYATPGYEHQPFTVSGAGFQAHEVLPGAHRVASLVKWWLEGTHQVAVAEEHLPAYLDDFTFRFNRRRSQARGLLFYRLMARAVEGGPRSYRDLVAKPRKRKTQPTPPTAHRLAAASVCSPAAMLPWRNAGRTAA